MSDIIGNEAVLANRLAGLRVESMEPSSAPIQRKTLREWIATCTTESQGDPEHPLDLAIDNSLYVLDRLVQLSSKARSQQWSETYSKNWSLLWDEIETLVKRLEDLDNEARDRCTAGIDHLFPLSQTVDGTSERYLDHIMEAADSQRDAAFNADSVLEQAKSGYELALRVQLEAVNLGMPSILIKDFTRGLLGSGVQNLDHRICALEGKVDNNGMKSTSNIYARVLAILQSSGSGKSRTALGLTEHRLGMLVCVRRTASKKASWQSLPPTDDSVFKAIVPEIATSAGDSGDHRLIAGTVIIARWLEAFAEQFTKFTASNKDAYKGTSNQVEGSSFIAYQAAQLLNDIVPGFRTGNSPKNSGFHNTGLKTPRAQLLDDIDRCFEKSEQDWKDHVRRGGPVEDEEGNKDNDRPSGEGDLLVCTEYCAMRLRPLFTKLTDLLDGDDQYIFLAIDEASSLGERLPLLRRLLSYMNVPRFWVLLLDIDLKVSEISEATAADGSARLRDESLRLPSPFVRLPQDLYLLKPSGADHVLAYNALLYKGQKTFTFEELALLLPKMGKPLWSGRSFQSQEGVQVGGVALSLVFAKLLGSDHYLEWFNTGIVPKRGLTNDLPLTMACWRLPLNLTGNRDVASSTTFHEWQVSCHLRTLSSLHPSLPVMNSVAVSEPIVNLAVAHVFRMSPAGLWSLAIERIWSEVASNGLDMGDPGHQFVRTVLTLGLDLSILPGPYKRLGGSYPPCHLHLISVGTWLSCLVGPERYDAFPIQFKRWLDGRWLNFTHWLRLNSDSAPHSTIVQAWTRQTALTDRFNHYLPAYTSNFCPRPLDVFEPSQIMPITVNVSSLKFDRAAQSITAAGLHLHFRVRGQIGVRYVKTAQDDHSVYFGGHSAETFEVINKLSDSAQSALLMLGRGVSDDLSDHSYLNADGQYSDPQMEDLMDGALAIP